MFRFASLEKNVLPDCILFCCFSITPEVNGMITGEKTANSRTETRNAFIKFDHLCLDFRYITIRTLAAVATNAPREALRNKAAMHATHISKEIVIFNNPLLMHVILHIRKMIATPLIGPNV